MTQGAGPDMGDIEKRLAGLEAGIEGIDKIDGKLDKLDEHLRAYTARQITIESDVRRVNEDNTRRDHRMDEHVKAFDSFRSDTSATINQIKGGGRVLMWIGGIVQTGIVGVGVWLFSNINELQDKVAKLQGLVEPVSKVIGKLTGSN